MQLLLETEMKENVEEKETVQQELYHVKKELEEMKKRHDN